jgi:hypothetical protein
MGVKLVTGVASAPATVPKNNPAIAAAFSKE